MEKRRLIIIFNKTAITKTCKGTIQILKTIKQNLEKIMEAISQ